MSKATSQQSYQTIADFFGTYSLSGAEHKLGAALKAAGSEKICNTRSPADLLYFFERLEGLLDAVFLIVSDQSKREEACLKEYDKDNWELTNYKTYCGWHGNCTPWHFFPRHLTQKEFLDPYKALKKFTRCRNNEEWREILKDLLQHALSPHNIYEFDDSADLLNIWLLLHKLLEASHLIEVRAIHEDENGPRPKWKDSDKPGEQETKDNEKHEPGKELTAEEQAWNNVKGFFNSFNPDDVEEELWTMIKRALTNEKDETSAHDRSNMIFLYEELRVLIDAINTLHQLKN